MLHARPNQVFVNFIIVDDQPGMTVALNPLKITRVMKAIGHFHFLHGD